MTGCVWSENGELVTVLRTEASGGQEQVTIWRTLSDDGTTLTQRITFEHADGTVSSSRVFRRGG